MTLLITFFLISIVFSFICSILEAVLLSVTPSYIKRKQTEGQASGKMLAEMKKDIDRPLSAILTLNTIAHTVGAIGVGAQAGKVFGTKYIDIFGYELSYESVVAALMTLGILFLSEIIPKTIGANNWKTLAPMAAVTIRGLVFVLYPFVWISNMMTRIMKKDKEKSVFSKQDYVAMTDMVGESGEIKKEDHELIRNVLRFDDLVAKDVMTPKPVMFMVEENTMLKDFYEQNPKLQFSRIPLFHGSRDTISGMLLKDDLLSAIVEGKGEMPLKNLKREVTYVEDKKSLREVFKQLHEQREHIAVVVNHYGAVLGLLTLEDIFETLFGLEIMDETDSVSDLQQYARKKWEERAKKIGLIK